MSKAVVAREDLVVHHTCQCTPAAACKAPYRTHSMTSLPMLGDAVRTTLAMLTLPES